MVAMNRSCVHDGLVIQSVEKSKGWRKGTEEKERKNGKLRDHLVQVWVRTNLGRAIARAGPFNAGGRERGPRRRNGKKNAHRRMRHFSISSIEGAKKHNRVFPS